MELIGGLQEQIPTGQDVLRSNGGGGTSPTAGLTFGTSRDPDTFSYLLNNDRTQLVLLGPLVHHHCKMVEQDTGIQTSAM